MQNKRFELDDDVDRTQRIARPTTAAGTAENEDRLFAAVQEYTAAKEAGRPIKREELLRTLPGCRQRLVGVPGGAGVRGLRRRRDSRDAAAVASSRGRRDDRRAIIRPSTGGFPAHPRDWPRRNGRGL